MGIVNGTQKNKMPMNSDNADIMILKQMLEQMEQVVNNQADALRRSHNKMGELLFKITKMDEQIQITKVNLRCEKDKNTVILHTLIHLGIIEPDTFNIVQSIIQNKILPVNSEGNVRSTIRLSRYNCHPAMPNPQGAQP